jgi:hypothetical protein
MTDDYADTIFSPADRRPVRMFSQSIASKRRKLTKCYIVKHSGFFARPSKFLYRYQFLFDEDLRLWRLRTTVRTSVLLSCSGPCLHATGSKGVSRPHCLGGYNTLDRTSYSNATLAAMLRRAPITIRKDECWFVTADRCIMIQK